MPSAADLATPFGMLWQQVHEAVDPTRDGSVVFEMNAVAVLLGFPEFVERMRAAALVLACVAAACGTDGSGTDPDTFIAFASTFAPFRTWTHFHSDGPADDGTFPPDVLGPRDAVHQRAAAAGLDGVSGRHRDRRGSRDAARSSRGVKRGGDFNSRRREGLGVVRAHREPGHDRVARLRPAGRRHVRRRSERLQRVPRDVRRDQRLRVLGSAPAGIAVKSIFIVAALAAPRRREPARAAVHVHDRHAARGQGRARAVRRPRRAARDQPGDERRRSGTCRRAFKTELEIGLVRSPRARALHDVRPRSRRAVREQGRVPRHRQRHQAAHPLHARRSR